MLLLILYIILPLGGISSLILVFISRKISFKERLFYLVLAIIFLFLSYALYTNIEAGIDFMFWELNRDLQLH